MVDPELASRLQFALTTIVHIVFPVMSMGLAPFLVYFTWKEVRDGDPLYERLRRFWSKIFAVSFAAGTVTGIVLEFEFGTNFAAFSRAVGELFGGPLAVEGMLAFFLEATFLGVFLFGRERVSDRLYFLSAFFVALGSWLSALWILIANSWMQTPRGFEVARQGGQPVVTLVDPIAAYANPRFPWMYVHMQNAAVLSVALFVAGVAAYKLRRGTTDLAFWRTSLKSGLAVTLVTAPLQILHGDAYARHVYLTQPAKFAAMEAIYQTESCVPEYIVAFPMSWEGFLNPRTKELFGIALTCGASWLVEGDFHAEIVGLADLPGGAPPVAVVFWTFRLMVFLGFWFVLLAFWAGYRWWSGELFEDRLLHKALVYTAPLGFAAVELGWVVTEVGRQPWVVQGVIRTAEGVSPGLSGTEATLTLLGFVAGYAALLVVYGYVVKRLISAGPDEAEHATAAGTEVAADD